MPEAPIHRSRRVVLRSASGKQRLSSCEAHPVRKTAVILRAVAGSTPAEVRLDA